MGKTSSHYSLGSIQQKLIRFLSLLDRERLLEGFDQALVYKWVKESGPRGKNRRVHTIIEKENALCFTPIDHGDTVIVADICTRCICKSQNNLSLDKHTVLIRLWDRPPEGESRVLYRVHIDLAESGQAGPWSHLQVGGRKVDDSEKWLYPLTSEINEFRWPYPLFDVVLACELVVYCLWPDKWSDLCTKPEFVSPIRDSEQSYIKRYFESWTKYERLNGSERETFLATLCNRRNEHPWLP